MIDVHLPQDDAALPGATATNAQHQADQQATDAAGPFQRDDADLLRIMMGWFKEAADAMKVTRPKRTKDWSFYANDQWEKADAEAADRQKRPRMTLNMIQSIINAVEGEERTNRQEMKFYGEGQEDDDAAYAINRLVRWIMDQCGGQFALSHQFRSGIICGEGWVVPDVDYFDDPNGKIKLLHVDDEEMFVDPLSTDPTAGDARYLHRVRMMTEDELNARWPGKKDEIRQQCYVNNAGPETDGKGFRDIYSTPNDTGSPKLYDAQRKLWAVMETWWSQIEPGWIVVDEQTNLLVERTPDEFEAMRIDRENAQRSWLQSVMQRATAAPPPAMPGAGAPAAPIAPSSLPGAAAPAPPAPPAPGADPAAAAAAPPMPIGAPAPQPPLGPMPPPLQAVQRPIRRFYQAFWSYGTLLEKQASPLTNMKRFPYVAFRGLWDKVMKEWFGIVRPILDIQRQHNVEQSVIVQLMQLMPKQSWMAPKGAYHDRTKWQEGLSQPGAMLEYNVQRGKPEPIPVAAIPRHLIDMAVSRPASMREICGVNVDMMGQRVASDPGVVMEMRQKSAKTVLAPLFDNFRMTKMALGKVMLAYVQAYLTPGRRIRVLGPEGQTYVEMTLDMSLGDYDLTVEETNATVNDRMATLAVMQTTLPQMMKAGVPIPASFVDLLPMQPHIREDWKLMIQWQQAVSGQVPPPGWRPGMPVPPPSGALSPGAAPPAGAPPVHQHPAAAAPAHP